MAVDDGRLHPLHDPKWVANFLMSEGRLPARRGTGRTTIGILRTIVDALENPHSPQAYIDHHFMEMLARIKGEAQLLSMLERQVDAMVHKLGLRGLRYVSEPGSSAHEGWYPARVWICFGQPDGWHHRNWSIIDGV